MRLGIIFKPMTLRTVARSFFLALGLVCLGSYSSDYVGRANYQSSESHEFDRMMTVTAAGSMPAILPPRRPSPNALIGRLSVPRLHLSAMVREGIDSKTLKLAVGHIPATSLPGQAGNVGVAGHRDTFFRGLKDMTTGDEILFSTLNGDFRYVVELLTIVEPDDAGALAPSAENVLTMVTCYPFYYVGDAPRRFVVRARQAPLQTLARLSVK
jgi:sortase A